MAVCALPTAREGAVGGFSSRMHTRSTRSPHRARKRAPHFPLAKLQRKPLTRRQDNKLAQKNDEPNIQLGGVFHEQG
jgi:hypothetical protein